MTIVQKPNPLLIIFLAALIIQSFVDQGTIHQVAYATGVIAGIIWSYQEITTGVNWVRKLLGVIVLALIGFSLYR